MQVEAQAQGGTRVRLKDGRYGWHPGGEDGHGGGGQPGPDLQGLGAEGSCW